MKKKASHITELFKKFFGGNISRIDQHRLDEIIKVDDYARDAKEGGDQLSNINRDESFEKLEKRLAQRINKNRNKTPLTWLKLAAGIAILISVAMFIWQPFEGGQNVALSAEVNEEATENNKDKNQGKILNRNYTPASSDVVLDSSNDISQNSGTIEVANVSDFVVQFPEEATIESEKVAQPERKVQSDVTTISSQRDEPSMESRPIPNSAVSDIAASNDDIENARPYRSEAPEPLPSSASPIMELESESIVMEETVVEDNIEKKKETLLDRISSTKAGTDSARSKTQNRTRVINGKVTDQNGEPLIGVSIVDEKNTNGTVTDVDGEFSLETDADVREITSQYIGYKKQNQRVDNEDNITIQLIEEEGLSEIVVTGAAQENSENSSSVASPVDGFSNFKKYITSNLRYPEQAKQAGVEGKVVLLFNITNKGRPTDIEVKKSLGYGCDEEAIRLLVEGPDWEQGSTSAKARVVVRFR